MGGDDDHGVGGGKGFDRDENELLVLWAEGGERLALQDKRQLADELIALIDRRMQVAP